MADHLTPAERTKNMRRIRSRDTKPEIAVRSCLHALGYRFRLHRRDLPGTPDIVLPRYWTTVFVHGCFWHQHQGCERATMPKSNQEYWLPKLGRNRERFEEVKKALLGQGWTVEVVWECETGSTSSIVSRINSFSELRKYRDL